MKTFGQDSVVADADAEKGEPIAGQTVEIQKRHPVVIGIAGTPVSGTSWWRCTWRVPTSTGWQGSTTSRSGNADGTVLESLPVNATREAYEKDGETVFFLSDAE